MTHRHLDSGQRQTLEHISRHPLSNNVKWPQVLALLEALGEVTVESKDRFRVAIGDRTEVFHPPHHGDLPAEMMVRLRHFVAERPEGDAPPVP